MGDWSSTLSIATGGRPGRVGGVGARLSRSPQDRSNHVRGRSARGGHLRRRAIPAETRPVTAIRPSDTPAPSASCSPKIANVSARFDAPEGSTHVKRTVIWVLFPKLALER